MAREAGDRCSAQAQAVSAVKADTLPLWLACGLYLWQAANYMSAEQKGMALGFVAYALANVGFILAARGV